jgi:hypothetical protein
MLEEDGVNAKILTHSSNGSLANPCVEFGSSIAMGHLEDTTSSHSSFTFLPLLFFTLHLSFLGRGEGGE